MKTFYLPLFWKFTIAVVLVVALFGSINIALIWREVYVPLDRELENRGVFIAKSLAGQAISPMLYEDVVGLQKLVDNTHEIDSTIEYAFILNNHGKVMAHSFEKQVPVGLIQANPLDSPSLAHVQSILPKNHMNYLIKDIAVPILDGRVGVVRVGLLERHIRDDVNKTVDVFFLMVSSFLILGLSGAFIFAHIITGPVKKIADIAEHFELESLTTKSNTEIITRKRLLSRLPQFVRTEDELDILSEKFNEMIARLEKTYRELRSTQKHLLQSEKLASIGTLASGIAHEINNPVAGLQNCIRRLSRDATNLDQNKKYLSLMADAANRIETIVKALLNYSRKHDVPFGDVDIVTLIENALVLTGHRLEKHRIGFEKAYPERIPLVRGNANQLEQVVVNLVINAVDAIVEQSAKNPECHKTIFFRISPRSESLVLEVEDTGVGISPENIDKIFDPFYTTKAVGEGTGLGLAVSYNIIKDHDGDISVKSVPGKNTTFQIVLPISHKERSNQAIKQS
jgi:two-component system NtrC family sensor kinase